MKQIYTGTRVSGKDETKDISNQSLPCGLKPNICAESSLAPPPALLSICRPSDPRENFPSIVE